MENKNKFIQLADSIYADFIQDYIRTHSGIVDVSYTVAVVKVFHLLIRLLVYYLDSIETIIDYEQ